MMNPLNTQDIDIFQTINKPKIMRKAIFILTLLVAVCCSVQAQTKKSITTKPSVAQLISVATSSKPLSAMATLAKQYGYTKTTSGSVPQPDKVYADYVKVINGKPRDLCIGVYKDGGGFISLWTSTHGANVAEAWEAQLKSLGYHYDSHQTRDGLRGLRLEEWIYTKIGKPKIALQYSEFGSEYTLIIDDSIGRDGY
jgi:hypothetical protein